MRLRWLFLIGLILLPSLSYAAVFDVTNYDKSMQYLARVFGDIPALPINLGAVPDTEGNLVFSQLINKLNIVIFTLGIVIVIYTTFVGTVSTAQEGEVLGKKWSTIWIPARIGIGMYLLLPAAGSGGYSYLQVAVLWALVQGVGGANAIWTAIVADKEYTDTRKAELRDADEIVKNMFKSALCMEYINNEATLTVAAGEAINVYRSTDLNTTAIGRPSRSELENAMCGSFKKSSYSNLGVDPSAAREIIHTAVEMAFWSVHAASFEAAEIVNGELYITDESTWTNFSYLPQAVRTLKDAISGMETTRNLDDEKAIAVQNGWIHAGSYYFNLIQAGSGTLLSDMDGTGLGGGSGGGSSIDINLVYTQPDMALLNELTGDKAHIMLGDIDRIAIAYVDAAEQYLDSGGDGGGGGSGGGSGSGGSSGGHGDYQDLGFTTEQSQVGGDAAKALDAIFGSAFKEASALIGEYIHSRYDDPIVSISRFGSDLVIIAEAIWIGALIAIALVWMMTSIMCCMQPLCNSMNFVLGLILPIAGIVISILWVEGLIMALYIPMIPYLVFTFAALTWIIVVIEALVSAPLIGLSLVIPSEDELGKATTGLVILFGIVMRPPLMVIGFLFAMKLILVAFAMLSFGFGATMQYSVRLGIGIFGFIAVIMLYMGVALVIVHECFSLIYKVPDQTMRWIGAQGAGGDEGSKVKGVKGSVEKTGAIGSKLMSGSMSGLSKGMGVGKYSKGGGKGVGV